MSELRIPKIAILASGGGTTAEAYARAIHEGAVEAEIGLVVSSSPTVGIIDRVSRWNAEWGFDTESAVINKRTHPGGPQLRGQTTEESEGILELVEKNDCDLIACLGYMIIINDPLMENYGFLPNQHTSKYQAGMINSHPGPLPLTADTDGKGAATRVLEAYHRGEVYESMHTVHVVSQGVDQGPTVTEHPVAIEPDDTIESLKVRTQIVERATIAYAIDKFLRDQAEYEHGRA